MNTDKHSLFITAYDYSVLTKNYIISILCAKQMRSAKEHGDEVELIMTFSELEDLIGYVAAEANHAKTRKQRADLNLICDYLESVENRLKFDQDD
jgi:hypothetical protein